MNRSTKDRGQNLQVVRNVFPLKKGHQVISKASCISVLLSQSLPSVPGGGLLPYMGHIGMCRCEGYGFQAIYSSIGYINQSVWV